MKAMKIAATMVVAANLAYATVVTAQTSDAAPASPAPEAAESSDEDVFELLSPEAAPTEPKAAAAKPALPDVITLPEGEPETVPGPQAKPRKPPTVEEIIVTAQRREERAQDVPISMTVFSQAQLANANMTSASDLATYTPSLTTNQRFGPDQAGFAIRGFTQELRTTASVGTYFAEVVAPRGQSAQTTGDGAGPGSLFDLQNVQVLKGPQGTLFGRNTTGGAVLLVPNKPSSEFEGYTEVSAGGYDMRRVQAVVNLPVTDSFKLRLGLDDNMRRGHLNNITDIGPKRLGNVDYTAVRLSSVLNITDDLENYTILSYVDSNNRGYSRQMFACNTNPDPTANPFFAVLGQACQDQLDSQAAAGHDGFYDLSSSIPNPLATVRERRFINTTTWGVTDDLTIKNILAYAHLHTLNYADLFGTQFRASYDPGADREFSIGVTLQSPDVPVTSQEVWVEELQVQGQALEGALKWQTGAYYEHSTPDGFSGYNVIGLMSCEIASIAPADPSQFNCFDPTNGALGSVLFAKYKAEYLNRAVYAQATYEIVQQLSVTGGLRYTWDRTSGFGRKTVYSFVGTVAQPPSESTLSPTVETDAPTWLLDLSYKPVDDVMVYAKYVRGYRQGSIVLAADEGISTFDAEKVNTYEIGAKTSFGGLIPGRFNLSAYYNDLTNQQMQGGYISRTSGPTTAIFNAGKSRIAGVEVEAYFKLLEDLTLELSYAHLDTKLLEQDNNQAKVEAAAGPVAGQTFTPSADVGDELPFAPDHMAVASLTYRLPLASEIGAVELGATYVYTGSQRSTATSNSPFSVLDSFELLNLNLNWSAIFGAPLGLSLFATNVLDEEYVTFTGGGFNSLGVDTRMMGLPRMIGARLKYSFGS